MFRALSPSPVVHALLAVLAGACAGLGAPAPFPPEIPELAAENREAGDPHAGRFPLEEALAGLPGDGAVVAEIVSDEGSMRCTLDLDVPLTVADFVGLARGLRPFYDGESWIRARYYDGSSWHRAQAGEFVQAGRRGQRDDPGYRLQDEHSPGHKFDRPGLLALANRGAPHTGGGQFFVTTAPLPGLSGQYTIFGTCDDEHVARALEARVLAGEAPRIETVRISRR